MLLCFLGTSFLYSAAILILIYHIFFSEKRARNNWYFFGNNPSIAVIFSIFSLLIFAHKLKLQQYTAPYFSVAGSPYFHFIMYFYSHPPYSKFIKVKQLTKIPRPERRSSGRGTVLRQMRRLYIPLFLNQSDKSPCIYHLANSLASSAVISR